MIDCTFKVMGKTVFLVVCLVVSLPALSDPFFETDEVLEFELEGPFQKLIDNKEDKTERPFTLREGGAELNVLVRTRGNSRLRVCDFPPLRLDFSHDQPDSSSFSGQDELKLVTHCRGKESGQKNVVEEYAAYRIFNLLSDVSYRVRLARIRYIDSSGQFDTGTEPRFAFFIEPKDTLAGRTGGSFVDRPAVKLSWLNQEQASLVYVFQYWIGNTDWSLLSSEGEPFCCHNGDLLEIDSELFYVPYDFDLSGLVNASYAKPDPSLRLRNVTQRRYRGYCTKTDALRSALRKISSLEQETVAVIQSLPVLSQRDKDKKVKYLENAYEKAEKEGKMLASFEKSCLGGD